MSTEVIFIIGFMMLVYGGVLFYMNAKKKKMKETMQHTDFKAEFLRAAEYKSIFLNGELKFLQEQMEEKLIDAFNFGSLAYSNKSAMKDGMKDALKSVATLGTVKFHTVQTAKYFVLSGSDLHLLDTDTDGNINNHLVFDKQRLSQSTLTEIPLEGTMKAFAKQKGDGVKAYEITLATDGEPIVLNMFSALLFTHVNSSSNMLSMNMQKVIQENVIANDFLKKLGDKYSKLKVTIPLLD